MSTNDMIALMTFSGKMKPNLDLIEESAPTADEEDED